MLKSRYVTIGFLALTIALIAIDVKYDIPFWYYLIEAFVYSLFQAYGVLYMSAAYFVPTICKGKSGNGIALTFDDGPVPGMTERIMEILADRRVKATFFCIGNRVKQHPEIVKRLSDEGHVVGNHSYNHGKFFDMLPTSRMEEELKMTNEVISAVTSRQPRFFRPPYGVTNPNLAKAITRGEYKAMGWSVRSFDTIAKEDDKLFASVTGKLKGGDVILFHDYCEITIRILPRVLDYIDAQGLKVVNLDELVGEVAYR